MFRGQSYFLFVESQKAIIITSWNLFLYYDAIVISLSVSLPRHNNFLIYAGLTIHAHLLTTTTNDDDDNDNV